MKSFLLILIEDKFLAITHESEEVDSIISTTIIQYIYRICTAHESQKTHKIVRLKKLFLL